MTPLLDFLRQFQPLSLLVTPLWLIYLTYEICHVRKRASREASAEPTVADQALEQKIEAVRKSTLEEVAKVYADLAASQKKAAETTAASLKEQTLRTDEHMARISNTLTKLAQELGNVTGAVDILAMQAQAQSPRRKV